MKKKISKQSFESNADFKSTCCGNILSNLYSLLFSECTLGLNSMGECGFEPDIINDPQNQVNNHA